jgi:hypothetical protein
MILAVAGLAVGCQIEAASAAKPSETPRGWHSYVVEVGEHVVRFSVPRGESHEYPAFTVPDRIDVDPGALTHRIDVGSWLLRRFWDYGGGWFAQPDGTLSAVIGTYESDKDMLNQETLMAAVQASSQRFENTRSRPAVLEAQNTPLDFQPVSIHGKQWLRVTYRLSGDSFVTILDSRHYLCASFGLSDFATRPDSRAAAKVVADRILNSIQVDDRALTKEPASAGHEVGSNQY